MKQMSLIEMDGFLKGKCIPNDLKVNETNAEYLVRKFGELESKLETALRECRSAGITIDNLEGKCAELAAELSQAKSVVSECREYFIAGIMNRIRPTNEGYLHMRCDTLGDETPSHDAFLAEVRAQGVDMFALMLAEEAIKTDNITTGWRAMASRSASEYAEALLEDAAQLRKGGNQ
ncbi:hypothetical protein RA891_000230 [Escherichia coli]|uniref:hypothetical protein n=1 Tax=Escherichia coli TaxID=562 RepID=UPI00188AD529|nr:hypothetical protein [Escherichia coli]ELF8278622.1 hypothetical protein [Escherichia coli]MBF2869810.1 hypothetical protein [Escherichia coli]